MAYYPSLLYLKEFRCVVETEGEGGNDSPYFIIFVGNLAQENFTDVVRLRMEEWDEEAYSGKLFTPNLWAHNHVDGNTAVAVVLLEEDWDPDIGSNGLVLLRTILKAKWNSYKDWNLTTAQRATLMAGHLATYTKDLLGNDEFIQARTLPITTASGDLPLLNFYGDGAHYRVRFKMVNTQA